MAIQGGEPHRCDPQSRHSRTASMRDPVEAASKGCSRANHYSFRDSSSAAEDSRYGAVAEEEALHLNTLDFQRGRREGSRESLGIVHLGIG